MTFQEWFNSAPQRAKYDSDHPAYLAAQEAWGAAHEACAKVCDETLAQHYMKQTIPERDEALFLAVCADCAAAIRARSNA